MILIPVIARYNDKFVMDVPKKYRIVIILRGIVGFLGYCGCLGELIYLPVGIASCVDSMANMWAPIWAKIFYKEPLKISDALVLILAFGGVVLINNPFEEVTKENENKKYYYLIGTLIGVGGSFFSSWTFMCMRYMKTIHPTIGPFYFGSCASFFSPIGLMI